MDPERDERQRRGAPRGVSLSAVPPSPAVSGRPYLSFVLATRNDDYAGGLSKCLWGIGYLAEQCDEFGLSAEALVVEWNPVPGRPGLAEALDALPWSRSLSVRVVSVPAAIHARYRHADRRPMHGAVAANVGIRRARGEFVVFKSADTYYPDAVVRRLAGRALHPDRLYRLERWDVAPEAAMRLGAPRERFLGFCAAHVVLRNAHLVQARTPFSLPDLFTNACGDFQLLSSAAWARLRGYRETASVASHEVDSMLSYSAYAAGLREELLGRDMMLFKIAHGSSHSSRLRLDGAPSWPGEARLKAIAKRVLGDRAMAFWLRAALDYPRTTYAGVRVPAYERSLIRFKLLGAFPALTRLKSANWGLAGEALRETRLRLAAWESPSAAESC